MTPCLISKHKKRALHAFSIFRDLFFTTKVKKSVCLSVCLSVANFAPRPPKTNQNKRIVLSETYDFYFEKGLAQNVGFCQAEKIFIII
jgi:hypothetical protein